MFSLWMNFGPINLSFYSFVKYNMSVTGSNGIQQTLQNVKSTVATLTSNAGKIENGTATTPGLAFKSDTNTGLFRVSEDVLGVATGGVERMRISSSGLQVGGQTNIQSIVTGYTGTTTVNANSFKSVLVNHPFGSINFVALFTISLVTGSASIQPSYTTKSSTQVEFMVRNYDTTQSTVFYLDYVLLKL